MAYQAKEVTAAIPTNSPMVLAGFHGCWLVVSNLVRVGRIIVHVLHRVINLFIYLSGVITSPRHLALPGGG